MANRIPLVYILSDEKPLTEKLGDELTYKSCKVIYIHKYEDLTEIPDYFFILLGFSENEIFNKHQVDNFLDFAQASRAKGEVILPYTASNFEYVSGIATYSRDKKLQIIYLGDLFGERVSTSFEAFWNKDRISVPVYNYDLYLLSLQEAVRFLIKGAFSYGFDKKEVVLAYREDVFSFIKRLQELLPMFKFETDRLVVQKPVQPIFEFVSSPIDNQEISKTLSWLSAQKMKVTSPKLIRRKVRLAKRPRVKINFKFGRFLKVFVFMLWIMSLPFLSLFLSSVFLRAGFERLTNYDLVKSNIYFKVSKGFAKVSNLGFFMFDEGKSATHTLTDIDMVGEESISLLKMVSKLNTDSNVDLNQLYLQTDLLYNQTSFLAANRQTINFLPQVDFREVSFYLNSLKKIAKDLPVLIGDDTKTNYLILIQDGRELRPTGGKISSLGVVSFQNGKVTDSSFFDVKTVDEQLRGHVDAPATLQKYLNLTNWNLSDSNWDPDFKVAAAKAEWFFENETVENIDGVIGIDLDTYNFLKNFNGNFLQRGNGIIKNLTNKNIQIFSDDAETENSLSVLNWDGGLGSAGYIGVVEANLGGNKISNQIDRSAKLMIDTTTSNYSYKLTVNYVNSSSETYKNYIRVIASDQAEMGYYLIVPAGKTGSATFNWVGKTEKRLTLRRQPGVPFMSTSIVINNATRYNTNLTGDFVINL